jgi:predicted ATP-dependent endonuclease of OLD family
MKIEKIIINNFRAYKGLNKIILDNLTVFVGQNDVGKSTVLEALDIFFNDGKGVTTIEKNDLNKDAEIAGESEFSISVIFSSYPTEIDLDAGNKTTLDDEYLLNQEELLEIRKVYKNGKCKNVFLVAYHPTCELGIDLLLKKRDDLKKIVQDHNFGCSNKNKNAELRKSIWENCGDLLLQNINIPINEKDTDAKTIWDNLQKYLPIYALFQSDRPNKDNDPEVQNPLKWAVQDILKKEGIQNRLQEIAEEVKRISTNVANLTLEKLKELSPKIAKQLKPDIPDCSELKWSKVFEKISITSDNNIPLNKRGSGVRRLVLISFFAAEAERRMEEKGVTDVIYAIEEPETSQHPDHQKFLIDSLIKLSQTRNTQILLTTHHPATAQLLPVDSIRLIKIDSDNNLQVYKSDGVLLEIANSLGVLPTISKVVICVEGESDRKFLLNINKILGLKDIIDIDNKQISIIPMNGSNLKNWINRNYLENSNVVEFHIYDKDSDDKYRESIKKVNSRIGKSCGVLTDKKEIENYVHEDLLSAYEKFQDINFTKITNWDEENIVDFILEKVDITEKAIKSIICGHIAKNMTKLLFEDLGAWEEVEGWFKKIKELFNSTV